MGRFGTKQVVTSALILLATGLTGCFFDQDDSDPPVENTGECAPGQWVQTEAAGQVCVVSKDIVLETGFDCPERVPHREVVDDLVVCSGRKDLPASAEEEIRRNGGTGFDAGMDVGQGTDGGIEPDGGSGDSVDPRKVDLLWVIDNSQSMCQEQAQIQQNFDAFVKELEGESIDFQLAVTTTHFDENSSFEKVARPGHLQATPAPVTSFDSTCRFAVDSTGEPIDHEYKKNGQSGPDYSPVLSQIQRAVECTANPQLWEPLKDPDRATIECALFGNNPNVDPDACEKAGKDPQNFNTEDLFPPQRAYRDIPLVLRSEEYRRTDGSLRLEKLQRDFSCMSFVGTRGSSQEQGLRAAVKAVSYEMTGGPSRTKFDSENERRRFYETMRKESPNYGLIRESARFGLIFVSDENDCSHKRPLVPENDRGDRPRISCGEQNCYFPTKADDQSPLLDTSSLYRQFIENLAGSKGRKTLPPDAVVAASLHGTYSRYGGPIPNSCSRDQQDLVKPVCANELGKAKSGDRYEDFIRQFEHFYPKPPEQNPQAHLTGWMCRGAFRPALKGIGEALSP